VSFVVNAFGCGLRRAAFQGFGFWLWAAILLKAEAGLSARRTLPLAQHLKSDNFIAYKKSCGHPSPREKGLMATLEAQLHRWREAGVLDEATAGRILQFEEGDKKTLRWPAILAVVFGTLMLCAGVLLFVSSHWDMISPAARFTLVLSMAVVFHMAAGLLGPKVESIGVALYAAGSIALGAGIFLAGQIFNLEEHWPSGILLWALGAVIGWAVLRQWPQAFLSALLVPWWIAGEWMVRAKVYEQNFGILAQGLLLLAILYFSTSTTKDDNRPLRLALTWAGGLALVPLTLVIVFQRHVGEWNYESPFPGAARFIGYSISYVPALVFTWLRRKESLPWIAALALWVAVLGAVSSHIDNYSYIERDPWLYLCLGAGATVLCFWGVRANRKLFINFGSGCFAVTVFAFYFSNVLDKLGRATGLMGMGALFLVGGWVLNRLRTGLIVRASEGAAR